MPTRLPHSASTTLLPSAIPRPLAVPRPRTRPLRRAAHTKQPAPLAYAPSPRSPLPQPGATAPAHEQQQQPQPRAPRQFADKDRWRELGYKSVSRRLVAAMVAAPVAIVTSYVLFERLVLGKEQRRVEDGASDDAGEGRRRRVGEILVERDRNGEGS